MRTIISYLKGFGAKYRHATKEYIYTFENWFFAWFPYMLKQIKEKHKLNEMEESKLYNLLYKVFFVKGSFDIRYDNILLSQAVNTILAKRGDKNGKL